MNATIPCPFAREDGQPCRRPLSLEVEPPDRSAGILSETIVSATGDCPHVAQANAEIEDREWDDTAGPMEEELYEALHRHEAEQAERYKWGEE